MKVVLKTALFFLGIIFFTGGACPSNDTTQSNKVAQTEIYQSYSVEQNGANYDVKAYFRIGGKTGTTLALSAPSKVTFNGQPMQEHLNTTSGTFYSAALPASTASGTFAFTDRNSKTYSNQIDLSRTSMTAANLKVNGAAPVAIPLSRVTADSGNFDLELNGQSVFLNSPGDATAEAYYDKPGNAIVILPAAWKKVTNGTVAIDLEVRDIIPIQQGTALGGEITFNYKTPGINASLAKVKSTVGTPPAGKTSKTAR